MQKIGSKSLNKGVPREIHGMRKPRYASGEEPAWAPSDKSGLMFWFDADAITGLNDGDSISTWEDSSSNNRDATQAGSNRPTYQTNELNGLPGVRFTQASNQYMEFGSDTLVSRSTTPYTVVWVGYTAFGTNTFRSLVSMKGTTTNLVVFMSGTPAATNYVNTNFGFAENGGVVGWRRGATNTYATTAAAGIMTYGGQNDSSATNYTGYKDNTEFTYSTPTGNFNSGANFRNYLGAFPSAGPTLAWDGMIFEIFAYNSVLTSDERTEIANYIETKWGITQA